MKKLFLTLMLVLAVFSFSGCSSEDKTGTLVLQITDAPPELNISSVVVTISGVMVHLAESDEVVVENSSLENESVSSAGWIVVVNESQTFDLIEIKDITEFLGSAELDSGKYTQIRLVVESAVAVVDGVEQELMIPSKVVKLTRGFVIEPNQTTTLTLDFDAAESIHSTGNSKFVMRPTIRVIQE